MQKFEHNFKVGDEVQLKLGEPRQGYVVSAGQVQDAGFSYDSPRMLVNAFHELTNEPQCVWLGANLQPYVAYFNPELLAKCV